MVEKVTINTHVRCIPLNTEKFKLTKIKKKKKLKYSHCFWWDIEITQGYSMYVCWQR